MILPFAAFKHNETEDKNIMRKLIVSINSSLNGVVTGPADDKTNFMIWAQAVFDDDSMHEAFLENFDTVDTILLGRATYEALVRQWPKVKEWPNVSDVQLRIGEKINTAPKIVVTGKHPLKSLEWGEFEPPTQLTGTNIEEQIIEIKEADGGDIITFGSPTLVQFLTNANLVDEYRILVHPVIVGEDGYKRLFENIVGRKDLKLLSPQTFEHGVVLMCYELVKLK